MSEVTYSVLPVFMIFQKYSRSGRRPLGSLNGKYSITAGSPCTSGKMFLTANSSNMGTLIHLTSLSVKSFFCPLRTYLRKSLLIIVGGGTYSCTWHKSYVSTWSLTTFFEVLEEVWLRFELSFKFVVHNHSLLRSVLLEHILVVECHLTRQQIYCTIKY